MLHILILAGGKATRMGSDQPKTLIDVKGKPILGHLLDRTGNACTRPTIVIGHDGDKIVDYIGSRCDYVLQKDQLGTAHAVACARTELARRKDITSLLVLYGDHPLVSAETAIRLGRLREKNKAEIAMATVRVPNFDADFVLFRDWGRVVRANNGEILKIVEVKDASDDEKKITEVSPSFFCFEPTWLWANLHLVKNNNIKREYYLTDMVNIAITQNKRVVAIPVTPREAMGANTPQEITIVSKYL